MVTAVNSSTIIPMMELTVLKKNEYELLERFVYIHKNKTHVWGLCEL